MTKQQPQQPQVDIEDAVQKIRDQLAGIVVESDVWNAIDGELDNIAQGVAQIREQRNHYIREFVTAQVRLENAGGIVIDTIARHIGELLEADAYPMAAAFYTGKMDAEAIAQIQELAEKVAKHE